MSKLISYRPDIDGLSAISVLVVILFHADLLWIQGGFIGVDVPLLNIKVYVLCLGQASIYSIPVNNIKKSA
tara:strand:- start:408 stop:620 length:213 start_codon:yes stop_codon:yes gene_type:complete